MTEFAPQLKLLNYPERIKAFLDGDPTSPPVQVEISPTNSCNAKCDWCFYVSSEYKQKHSLEEIDYVALTEALGEMSEMGVKAVSWTGGGDPSTYDGIDWAIECAAGLELKQGMFTNAYKPIARPELLDWIRVTVTEKFVITKHVADYATKTKVGVNFNLTQVNSKHLMLMATQAKAAGVHYFQVRPALADRWDLQTAVQKPTWLKNRFEDDQFRVVLTDYKWDDYLQPHGYKTCHGHRFVPFLWHNGDLAVCAYHFGKPEFTFGNIVTDGGFKAVWHGKRRRKMLEAGIGVIPDCQHCCKLHEINKPLASLTEGGIADKEFI